MGPGLIGNKIVEHGEGAVNTNHEMNATPAT